MSQAQYLLINKSSIFWLFDKVPDDSECRQETMLHRFRGNMVVSGCAPFEETKWKRVRIGNCDFEVLDYNMRIFLLKSIFQKIKNLLNFFVL